MKPETYIFRIDRFTPETLPMARLAQYLAEYAAMLGNTERVHFKKLKRGSACLVSIVEPEAAPKVRVRLQQAESDASFPDYRRAYDAINKLLAADNAVGTIKRSRETVVRFPGRKLVAPPRVGPFSQPTELQGQLVRVGGTDDTAHALVQDADGLVSKVTMKRDQARDLARYLYGATIRFSGSGRWVRDEAGKWELLEMRLHDWEVLATVTLREGIAQLREDRTDWHGSNNPHATLRRIRHGDDEVH